MGVILWRHLKHFDVGQAEGREAVGEASDMLSRLSQICTPHRAWRWGRKDSEENKAHTHKLMPSSRAKTGSQLERGFLPVTVELCQDPH